MSASQIDSKIISNNKIAKDYYLLGLDVPAEFKDARPGQFVHIKIDDSYGPLLRRPFSIYKISHLKSTSKKLKLEILYEVKGKGTHLLSQKINGEYLNILGPLGKGFDYQLAVKQEQIIIAGGAGVAPLLLLAEKLNKSKITVLIGAANSGKILCGKEFKNLGCEVKVATEDGSSGFKGKVTALFEKQLKGMNISAKKVTVKKAINVYACGPEAMLTALAKICLINKLNLQVSLEEFMGCGIGACLGCAIETKVGFKRVCHDGPVFKAEDIVWKF
jgi:dihydroorotate dehydrogenase electron transfer subunit